MRYGGRSLRDDDGESLTGFDPVGRLCHGRAAAAQAAAYDQPFQARARQRGQGPAEQAIDPFAGIRGGGGYKVAFRCGFVQ